MRDNPYKQVVKYLLKQKRVSISKDKFNNFYLTDGLIGLKLKNTVYYTYFGIENKEHFPDLEAGYSVDCIKGIMQTAYQSDGIKVLFDEANWRDKVCPSVLTAHRDRGFCDLSIFFNSDHVTLVNSRYLSMFKGIHCIEYLNKDSIHPVFGCSESCIFCLMPVSVNGDSRIFGDIHDIYNAKLR